MSGLWCDSFEGYDDLTERYDSVLMASLSATEGRFATGGLQFSTGSLPSGGYIKKTVTASSGLVAGMAWRGNNVISIDDFLMKFVSVATVQAELRLTTGSLLQVVGAGTAETPLSLHQWYYIEFKANFSTGAFDVQVTEENGTAKSYVSGVGSLNPAGSGTANAVWIGSQCEPFIDDLYVINTSGTYHNDFLGDSRVVTLYPVADGTFTDFTPSTGSVHYVLVDEQTIDEYDYVEATSGSDTYDVTNQDETLKDGRFAQLNMHVRSDGGDNVYPLAYTAGTVYNGAAQLAPVDSGYLYQIWDRRPENDANWTGSSLNNFEFGIGV